MNHASSDRRVDLLIIGKTGHGKSALGNSILRRDVFVSENSACSVTEKCDYEYGEYNDRQLKVVDVPGVVDTISDTVESVKRVMSSMEEAIKINPEGYHAFLLVVAFGQRFNAEEKNAITFLKAYFGENFVKNFCILVMTGGDRFRDFYRHRDTTFPEWCDEQTGDFRKLLIECNQRIILFDNVTADEGIKNKQVAELLKIIDTLASSGKRYTNKQFETTKKARDKLMIEAKEPMITEATMREMSLIMDKLLKISHLPDQNERMSHLIGLYDRIVRLYVETKEKDQGTGALHRLLDYLKILKKDIKYAMTSQSKTIQRDKKQIKEDYKNLKSSSDASLLQSLGEMLLSAGSAILETVIGVLTKVIIKKIKDTLL